MTVDAPVPDLSTWSGAVPSYVLQALRDALRHVSFRGGRVLQWGGTELPGEFVLGDLGAQQWVWLPRPHGVGQSAALDSVVEGAGSVRLPGGLEMLTGRLEGHFDLVIAFDVFQRVRSLPAALNRIWRTLREGGTLFAQFGPIWSSAGGSLFWIDPGFNFKSPRSVPGWAHLKYDREALRQILLANDVAPSVTEDVLGQVYDHPPIPPRFFEDYVAAVDACPLKAGSVEALWPHAPDTATQTQLESTYPGRREFSAGGVRIVASRPIGERVRPGRAVLICGSGRSGTSCLAGMFDVATHFHGDALYPATDSNPRGYFENRLINDLNESLIVHSLVQHLGEEQASAWLRAYSPGQLWLGQWPREMQLSWGEPHSRAIAALVNEAPFCYKDPRLCVTLPAWLREVPEALVLCVFRPPAVTAASMVRERDRAAYLRGFKLDITDALAIWCQQYRAVLRCGLSHDVIFVRYEDLFDPSYVSWLSNRTGTTLNVGFVDRALDRTSPQSNADPESASLYGLLTELSGPELRDDRAGSIAAIEAWQSHNPPQTARQSSEWSFSSLARWFEHPTDE